jgi:hypothetical protein
MLGVRQIKYLSPSFFLLIVFVVPGEAKEITKDKASTAKTLEVLSAYVNTAQFKDFPREVISRAKYLILDNIGCALGATQTDISKKFLKVAANWKSIPESTVRFRPVPGRGRNASFPAPPAQIHT